MPVHVAGPRLLSSIKFKHLVKKTAGGARASNISMNLTPFVDMMTILVTFLLMVFSSSGQLLQAQKGLDLPKADNQNALQLAPVIVIDKNDIKFVLGQTQANIGTVDSVLRDEGLKVDALFEKLEAAAKSITENITKLPKDLAEACQQRNVRPKPGHVCPLGLAILQADETTDAKLINKVVLTAKAAGFDNLMFAIQKK
jgi:biopolymer transport protein ExbD